MTAKGDLAFIPLGGTGEIGMNLNVYRCDGLLLAVDVGIGFGDAANPEVDVMMPDPGWLVARKAQLRGLVITHAHEDHIGAIAWLWPSLGCPIFCSPFAMAVARRKLAERGITNAPLRPMALRTPLALDPFTIEAILMQDFAIVRAMVFIGSVLYIAGLVLTDVSYTLFDPRVRLQ